MTKRWLALGASAVLALAACNNSEPTPNPELAFCDSLESLAQSVADLEELDAQSTVDDAQSAIEAVQSAAQGVRDTAGSLAEAQVDAIQEAASQLQDYSDTISGSETIGEVVEGLGEHIATLKKARREAGETHCGRVEAEAAASAAAAQAEAEASAVAEIVESAMPEEVASP